MSGISASANSIKPRKCVVLIYIFSKKKYGDGKKCDVRNNDFKTKLNLIKSKKQEDISNPES